MKTKVQEDQPGSGRWYVTHGQFTEPTYVTGPFVGPDAAKSAHEWAEEFAKPKEPSMTDNGHVLYTTKDCPYRSDPEHGGLNRCHICDGGLAECRLCGRAEIDLDDPCPGERPPKQGDASILTSLEMFVAAFPENEGANSYHKRAIAEIRRLNTIIKEFVENDPVRQAIELLTEGDPAKMLQECANSLGEEDTYFYRGDLLAVANTIEQAVTLLQKRGNP